MSLDEGFAWIPYSLMRDKRVSRLQYIVYAEIEQLYGHERIMRVDPLLVWRQIPTVDIADVEYAIGALVRLGHLKRVREMRSAGARYCFPCLSPRLTGDPGPLPPWIIPERPVRMPKRMKRKVAV